MLDCKKLIIIFFFLFALNNSLVNNHESPVRRNIILFDNTYDSVPFRCRYENIQKWDERKVTDKFINFTVYGEPIPLPRHRVSRSGIYYNPVSKSQNSFLQACKPFLPASPLNGAVEISLIFYFKRPKNHYRTGKNSHVLKDNADIWHRKRRGNHE